MIDVPLWISIAIATIGALLIFAGVRSGFVPTCIPGVGLFAVGMTVLFIPTLVALEVVSAVILALGVLMYLKSGTSRIVASAPTAFGVTGLLVAWASVSGLI